MKNITVIGGGTGSFAILSGLKKLQNVHLSAIVPSTDSGGSTGRLRDEFGYLPVGDVRQCLVALAENDEEGMLLRKLFSYRFEKGESGLKGHNFGNLFLTALSDILGDEVKSIKAAQKLLNIQGDVYPVTLQKCDLVAEYENGEIIKGEHLIDEPSYPHDGRLKIVKLYTDPYVDTHQNVKDVINNSDLIVMGPGDLYTSILANIVVDGISEIIRNSKAKVLYNLNLVTKFGQTYMFKASDHVKEIAKYLGREPDYVLVNKEKLPEEILEKYRLQNDYPVENDIEGKPGVIMADLLANEEIVTPKGDVLVRSLIRHDSDAVAKIVGEILKEIS
jgi:uncharacterized cofD-like protein